MPVEDSTSTLVPNTLLMGEQLGVHLGDPEARVRAEYPIKSCDNGTAKIVARLADIGSQRPSHIDFWRQLCAL